MALASVFDEAQFIDELHSGKPAVQLFRETLRNSKQQIRELFLQGESATVLVHTQAQLIDCLLHHAWSDYFSINDDNIALIAVGGYGRGELHPGSDIDILILLRDNNHDHYREALELFVMFLWDIGLEVGHSVRSLPECVEQASLDITIATNLMESRLLAGPDELYVAMRQQTGPAHIWPSRNFFEAKWQEQIQRYRKFDDTAYNLEPNIKEGPGGLRDIQMIGWVAKRHFNAVTLHDLVTHGFLTEDEHTELMAGQDFLWKVRFALHVLTKRREDRLLFDYQRTLAEQFGYQTQDSVLAVEQFMKQYYRTIMELSRLNEMLLQLFQEAILLTEEIGAPTPLNNRFQISKGFIEVTHNNIFQRYPFALLELFLLIQQNPGIKGVRAATIRLIRKHRDLIDDKFRNDLRNRSLFMEIFRQPRGLTHELRRMNRYGILARYLPPFGQIVGLMQYDLFHIYTVDEHTLMVVRNLRRTTLAEYEHELPFSSQLMKKIPKPETLYLAALFHDIAKGRGGDHSELGAREAMEFCQQHGLSGYDTRLVAWLVKNHLLMSSTAQRKDISDPEVITTFATQMGDGTHLDYLYLLTVADIRATNKTLWNSWKDALLFDLYQSTKRVLRRGLENPIDHSELIGETKESALQHLKNLNVDTEAITKLWASLPDDYFLRHSAEEIAWHSDAIIQNAGREFPLILVQQEAERGGTEIFIHMPHANHLFAATTRTLDQLGLTVMDARIITSDKEYTFDTYVVLEENGATISSEHRIMDILTQLKHELSQPHFTAKGIQRRTARQLKHFHTATQITFSQDPRNHRTVMDLITADRPGLLSDVGRALMECNIYLQNAKISTIGERVEDVFFIVDSEEKPVTDETQLTALQQKLSDYLAR
jgi:[protein-PII] uridylyltransferase